MSSEGYGEFCLDAAKRLMQVFKPAAVTAASNWQNALPAAVAARELGLPFFYEVRGFWEISRAAREPARADSDALSVEVKNETAVACAADKVFATINRFMRDELVRRGVERERVQCAAPGSAVPGSGLALCAIPPGLFDILSAIWSFGGIKLSGATEHKEARWTSTRFAPWFVGYIRPGDWEIGNCPSTSSRRSYT
jgi:hypothetical protein